MCGIAGIFSKRHYVNDLVSRVNLMVKVVRHRGPDDEGVEVVNIKRSNGGRIDHTEVALRECNNLRDLKQVVVFGHRRLSILDLSSAGHQPMLDPESQNWITYNGEIYNFPELRTELASLGHSFSSHCDTEVILKGYSQWGVGCWRRLRGIFALGLWDEKFQELHLVRDHLGVKPLYFSHIGDSLIFASEVRAILASGLVPGRLSIEGLGSFLKYGSVQEPCTLVRGVESVPAGHYLTCTAEGKTTVRHYWKVSECLQRNWGTLPNVEEVRPHLEESVRRQLISDVPVGVFLSGGVDSTVIAALAAQAQPGAIRTFCIGAEQSEFDESAEAAITAKFLKCQHTTLILKGNKVQELLTSAIASYDQPSYDGLNTYFISMLVREAGIKVALSGLGGDELFVGYDGFSKAQRMNQIFEWAHMLPSSLRETLGVSFAAFSQPGNAVWGTLSEVLDSELSGAYFSSRAIFSRRHIEKLTGRRIGQKTEWAAQSWVHREKQLVKAAANLEGVDRASFYELQTYMLSTLLRDSDQMSMAHGLELRVPLIDPVLLERVLPVAIKYKITGKVGKQLLFEALGNLLPPEVAMRRKRCFTLPFRDWLRRDLQQIVGERFLHMNPRGPWNERVIRQVWHDFQAGRVSWSRVLSLFVLENWLQNNEVST